MRQLLGFSVTASLVAITIAFLVSAGCAGNNAPAATPAPTPGLAVVTTTTPACQPGTTACPDGSCQNFTADNRNCGGCGNICPATFVCLQSQCINSATNVVATPFPH